MARKTGSTGARRASPESSVLPIHFEDRPGPEFERLCYAYLLHEYKWKTLEWYGQLGGDSGRDIWGVRRGGKTECFQCANHYHLKFRKANEDLGKLAAGGKGPPGKFTLITGGRVSAKLRERVKQRAAALGIPFAEVWSGPEFEERLRRDQPRLVRRFVEGVPFPKMEVGHGGRRPKTESRDERVLAQLAECFDRPAFTTEFREESDLGHFKQAITDTIEALNTGVRRLRDGTEIGRIRRRSQIADPQKRAAIARVVDLLVDLRTKYDELVASGEVRPCGCGKPQCGVAHIGPRAARVMDEMRQGILEELARVAPSFAPRLAACALRLMLPLRPVEKVNAAEIGGGLSVGPTSTTEGLQPLARNEHGHEEFRNGRDGSILIYVPPTEFKMGAENCGADATPMHRVVLDGYLFGKSPVTNAQYRAFCAATGHRISQRPPADSGYAEYLHDSSYAECPVVGVTWEDAKAYCDWAGLRMPTEAEWEHAARGADGRRYPWGNEIPSPDRAVFGRRKGSRDYTRPVGTHPKGASPCGALDMAGNVSEWCADWYKNEYATAHWAVTRNPIGPSAPPANWLPRRVIRGGSWSSDADHLQAARRNCAEPRSASPWVGFRVAASRPL